MLRFALMYAILGPETRAIELLVFVPFLEQVFEHLNPRLALIRGSKFSTHSALEAFSLTIHLLPHI
jgi:hypothetical protein